jgi:hypothetical protein
VKNNCPLFLFYTCIWESVYIYSRIVSVSDPDPDLNTFSANFFRRFFWWKYVPKSIFMNQKVKQQRFLKYWFTHTKKVKIGSFIKARIRIRSKTSESGSTTLVLNKELKKVERNPDRNNIFKLPCFLLFCLCLFRCLGSRKLNLAFWKVLRIPVFEEKGLKRQSHEKVSKIMTCDGIIGLN